MSWTLAGGWWYRSIVGSEPLLQLGYCHMWTVNPYARCDLRCIYCVTEEQGRSRPKYGAADIVPRLREELRARPMNESLIVGGWADAYPPPEASYGITRLVLTELIAQGRRFGVVTKSTLVLREADLLRAAGGPVQISISMIDDAVARVLEPGAPSPSARRETVIRLSEAGVDVTVAGSPWIPSITDARALIDWVPEGIPIQFAPLTLVPGTTRSPSFFGRRFDQDEINRRYLADRSRAGYHPHVRWLPRRAARRAGRSTTSSRSWLPTTRQIGYTKGVFALRPWQPSARRVYQPAAVP